MERAVLLSDIEFLDGVHESDWERIEEESFLVNVSKPLNENQQVVLEWLKTVYRENDIDAFTTILDLLRPTTLEDEQDSAYAALSQLKEADQFQVLAAFAEWGMKNEQ